jgi:hypothetical protein
METPAWAAPNPRADASPTNPNARNVATETIGNVNFMVVSLV